MRHRLFGKSSSIPKYHHHWPLDPWYNDISTSVAQIKGTVPHGCGGWNPPLRKAITSWNNKSKKGKWNIMSHIWCMLRYLMSSSHPHGGHGCSDSGFRARVSFEAHAHGHYDQEHKHMLWDIVIPLIEQKPIGTGNILATEGVDSFMLYCAGINWSGSWLRWTRCQDDDQMAYVKIVPCFFLLSCMIELNTFITAGLGMGLGEHGLGLGRKLGLGWTA